MKQVWNFVLIIIICLCMNHSAEAIRIGLYTEIEEPTYFGVSKGGVIADGKTGNYLLILTPMKPYVVQHCNGYIKITVDGKDYAIRNDEIVVESTHENNLVFAKKKWYKGSLRIRNTKNGLTVMNELDLENYIKGVVPSEMPPAWNIEAHKAQAIAARSYAVANAGKRGKHGYDLKDTDEDQVYKGVSSETGQTNAAVDATKGQVLIYNNKVISAYYHASAGGYTVSAQQAWGRDLPYTVPVKSFDDNVPRKGHSVGMSQYGANNLAKMGYNAYQILGYFYQNTMLRTMY